MLGHGSFFSNLPVEHEIDVFLTTLEQKDYAKAYGRWMYDPSWEQHPQKYDYTLKRFTKTGLRRAIGYDHIVSCGHIEEGWIGIVIAVRVNNSPKKLFIWYEKKDGTLTYSPHELEY
jgi:hypothetical protein